MSASVSEAALDRRTLLRGAILLVGGAAIAPRALAATDPAFFTSAERKTLDSLSETMIPRTDTPGAIDAGVPAFLDTLMTAWASPDSQRQMRDLLARLALTPDARPIQTLTAPDRTTWLTAQDAALLAAGDPAYRTFKRLILTGYYYSEAGATQELRYELIPGVWDPAMPMTPATRTWAA